MASNSIVLGISFGHGDSSAALIIDGRLVAAAEEERFTRVKHYALFPSHAIAYCLRHAHLTPEQVRTVAIARKPLNLFTRRLAMLWQHPKLYTARNKQRDTSPQAQETLPAFLKKAGLSGARIARVEHHFAHLMSARFLSANPSLALMSFDGLGDFVSAAIGKPTGNSVEILHRVVFPHSLGFFYTAMSQYLGFPHFGDEFKVMGLSSYGEPRYLPALRQMVREKEPFGFELNLEAFPILKHPIDFYLENAQPYIKPFYNPNLLTQVLGLAPRKPKEPLKDVHRDLAKSVQARFEEVASHMLNQLHKLVPAEVIALAGGCAHNSVWVGKIPSTTPFKEVVVAPASHDAGIAVGAAIWASKGPVAPEGGHWALLGPSHDETEAKREEAIPFEVKEHTFPTEAGLIDWIVDELCRKRIIGLFSGRMEFGPRALGSRSIIADPRWADMKDRLNERVKHRETFRPFAASVLWEHQAEWFKESFFSPTMEAVFEVKGDQATRIPGVVHVDKSCRIQSVTKETQSFYWNLIEAFRKKTGIPMLINTSFNDCEPIVCIEKDAWTCFAHSDLDHLVVGTRAFSRVRQAIALAG